MKKQMFSLAEYILPAFVVGMLNKFQRLFELFMKNRFFFSVPI